MTIDTGPVQPTTTPAAGWYPDAEDATRVRYWDGVEWTAHTSPAQLATAQPAAPASAKKNKKGWIIGGSIAAGVLVIGGIATAANGSGADDGPGITSGQEASDLVAVPDVVGMTVADAKTALTEAGFTVTTGNADADIVTTQSATELAKGGAVLLQGESADVEVPNVVGKSAEDAASALEAAGLEATYDGDDSAKVTAQSAKAGGTAQRGTAVTLTLEAPMTLAQESAVQSAQRYVDNLGGFSKKGLIDQLKYEQFSSADAKFAVAHIEVDWNEQAAQKAESYMDMGGFSKGSLRDQLEYEGFTDAQISHALKSVGY